jgi:hypothetical protein
MGKPAALANAAAAYQPAEGASLPDHRRLGSSRRDARSRLSCRWSVCSVDAGAGSGGYWNDWVEAHAAVGLAHRLDDEVAVVVTMTPLKARAHEPRAPPPCLLACEACETSLNEMVGERPCRSARWW